LLWQKSSSIEGSEEGLRDGMGADREGFVWIGRRGDLSGGDLSGGVLEKSDVSIARDDFIEGMYGVVCGN
jgi:hypothetical protein